MTRHGTDASYSTPLADRPSPTEVFERMGLALYSSDLVPRKLSRLLEYQSSKAGYNLRLKKAP
jgi:hypothetical protein